MFRIGVKQFLVLSTTIILVISIGIWIYRSEAQKAAVNEIIDHGGFVRYDFQLDRQLQFTYRGSPNSTPRFLVEWLGVDYFSNVQGVYNMGAPNSTNNKQYDLGKLSQFSSLQLLHFSGTRFVNLNSVGDIPNLKYLSIDVLDEIQSNRFRNPIRMIQKDVKRFQFLSKLKNLQVLHLPIETEETVCFLKNHQKLKHLWYGMPSSNFAEYRAYSPKRRSSIFFYGGPKTLRTAEILSEDKMKAKMVEMAESLKSLRNLESLVFQIENNELSGEINFWNSLSELYRLRKVMIRGSQKIDFTVFKSADIEFLAVHDTKVSNLPFLSRLKKLENLFIMGCKIENKKDLDSLSEIKNFQYSLLNPDEEIF